MRLSHILAHVEQQFTLSDLITCSYENFSKNELYNVTTQRVHARLSTLKDDWERFCLEHKAILIAIQELSNDDKSTIKANPYFTTNLYTLTHERYVTVVERLTALLEDDHGSVPSTSSSRAAPLSHSSLPVFVHHARLPRIDLPKFNGTPTDWLPFKDLFHSLVIQNPTLSYVEKLQYLKSSLTGTASSLLKNTTLTADNFLKSWEALTAFYENKRLLINAALQSLLSIKRMTRESSGELEKLYTNVMQIYRSLEGLQRPVEYWDDFLIFIVLQRIDSESVKAWEQHLGSSKDIPTWDQFNEFLVARLLSLKAYEKSRSGKSETQSLPTAVKAHYHGKTKETGLVDTKSCPLCKEKHYVMSCPNYSNKTAQQRIAIIKRYKLCYNCLGFHLASHCKSVKRCTKCAAKHHTSIHQTPLQKSTIQSTATESDTTSKHLAQRLRLIRTSSNVYLVGIGAQKATKSKGYTKFTLSPHFESPYKREVSVHILPKLTTSTPSKDTDSSTWTHLHNLEMADPEYYRPGSIDLILGADVYGRILLDGVVKGSEDSPIAQRTHLGWIVSGLAEEGTSSPMVHGYHVANDVDLYNLIRQFWTLEEIPLSMKSHLSLEEQECEKHFLTTHSRDQRGRYIVKLPFKKSVSLLGDSYTKAAKVLSKLLDRLNQNESYSQEYSNFISEYEGLRHMQIVDESLASPPHSYYLPHHGVWKEQSLTTKLRVVFNGSSPTTTGYSLNDILHTGSKLQNDLFDRILWRDAVKGFRTYELTTVTYGLACAPYLSLRVFLQLLQDEGSKYPLAVPVLERGRYVDDIFGGADSIDQAKEVAQQLTGICMAGGFKLRKWISNHSSVLDSIPEDSRIEATTINISGDLSVNTLGLCWQPATDAFQFSLNIPVSTSFTKRTLLSNIAKLYDPLGFLSPVIITAKIIIQELWILKMDWDDPLPDSVTRRWLQFTESLQDLPRLTFPRWVNYTSSYSIEIHGFCDASNQALAAAVYIRVATTQGAIRTTLLASKTKVAPLKKLTIPRLELSGACLLTRLVSHILNVFTFPNIPIFLWTDSSITYTWISNHPSRWKDFVQNRVSFIQDTLPQAKWRFVPGTENPADLATRGLTPSQLAELPIWWTGPLWLLQASEEWPVMASSSKQPEIPEERPARSNTVRRRLELWDLLCKFSNLTKLFRVTALCQRAVARFKRNTNLSTSRTATTKEVEASKFFWIQTIQRFYFHSEIDTLSRGEFLSKNSVLLRLNPFLDGRGLLRVGGRLQRSLLTFSEQHPLIIPRESPLTDLIVADAHTKTLHGGTQLTLAYIRKLYWIIGGRVPVKAFILKCVTCARFRQERAQQLMGQLPKERVTPARPFTHTGIDYAGPFTVKTWKGKNARTYKAYIALFVCYSSSAVHLELVTDYTADTFIAAYKRFTARRGICTTLSSDCGTTLKGADTELRRLFTQSTKESEKLAILLANDGTEWKFNPPAAPHFGGKWEAGVKSVKYHLNRVVGTTLLTYEEFTTLLTQIEAALNSRPLSPLSEDPEDLNPLTPGHLLMGCAPTVIPEPSTETIKTSHLSRWQLIRQMLESFWTRWSKECLQRYYARYKWNKPTPSLREGTLVLVVDERYPPAKWPLGRIIQVHPGKDGLVRVVTIRTQTSVLKRPITKICPLPVIHETL
ncbi:uncharacterized protein LOC120358265 [Solenopsis invicta]|uniref:uncharacterized protein LOC120358265 n=1 Tax=Solenopsis invicta TaxID=13686 RepID=UPI00193CF16A|nr:uncharacterized protein LOC120358265 [Solenopsis invicta]